MIRDRILSSVLLPAPFGPDEADHLAAADSKEMSLSAQKCSIGGRARGGHGAAKLQRVGDHFAQGLVGLTGAIR